MRCAGCLTSCILTEIIVWFAGEAAAIGHDASQQSTPPELPPSL